MTPIRRAGIALVCLTLAACTLAPDPTRSGPAPNPEQTGRPGDAASPSREPEATAPLPSGEIDLSAITQLCEAWDGQLPKGAIRCDRGIRATLDALGPIAPSVERLYFRYTPPCDGQVCFRDPARAWVSVDAGAAGDLLVELRIDRSGVVIGSPPVTGAPLPEGDAFQPPPVDRRSVPGNVPREVRDRAPLPLCGVETAGAGDPLNQRARQCFVGGVLARQPVEFISQGRATEGEIAITIDRYPGTGAVLSYVRDAGQWSWSACGISPVRTELVFQLAGLCERGELIGFP
jgi:hypothetical protein